MAANRVGVLTDGEKQVLLERYLDIVWLDDVSEVECVRCHRVPIHHYLSSCQHLFCRNCRTVFSDGGRWKCPQCHEYVTQLSDQDWQLEEHIYQIRAHCPNRKYGCPYQGQLSTIPGHLRSCRDTREAALPAEFKGITLDTVVNQMERLKGIVEAIHSEVKALREQSESNWIRTQTDAEKLKNRCEINWKQTEEMKITLDELTTNAKVVTQDINEQKQHLANVTPVVKDVKELKEKCESNWEQTKTYNDNVAVDLRLVRVDLLEQKQRLAHVKPVVKEVKELKDETESNWKRTETMVSGLTTDIQVLTQGLIEQREHMAQVEQVLDEREARDAVEMQQLSSQLEQQHTLIEVQIQHLNEQKERSASVEQALKEREARDVAEVEQVRSQLQQQTLAWETKWKDVEKQMDDFNKVLNGHKQRLVAIKDKERQDALEMQQLSSQVLRQQSLVDTRINKCEVHLNGMRMVMAQTQMPHDQLHSMTLVYEWHIRDIKIKDGWWIEPRESEVFPLTGYNYGAKAIIDAPRLINLQLIDYNQTKRPIDTRSMPKVTCAIINQSHNTQSKKQLNATQHSTDGIRTEFIKFDESVDYEKYIVGYSSVLHSKFTNTPYVVSNGMKVRLYMEPPSIARSFFSNDGILLWRLDNYKERKQIEVDGLIDWQESPYFYTSPQGYRVLITLSINEWAVGGSLWFVKGEFDSSLTLQFPHRLTMTIFNHTDQSKNLVLSSEGKQANYTYFNFETASAQLLESGGYVADDSVLIKAVVEPL